MTSTIATEIAAADVRAVRALIDAVGAIPMDQFDAMPSDLTAAINDLFSQFETRIERLDQDEKNQARKDV